jgi:hypothetical protein
MEEIKWSPIANEEIKWIGVDWDCTLFNNSGFPNFEPTIPMEGALEAMNELDKLGYKITIFTARPWSDYQNIENYCKYYNIPFRRIICGKPLFKFMVDDRAIGFRNNWKEVVKEITAS